LLFFTFKIELDESLNKSSQGNTASSANELTSNDNPMQPPPKKVVEDVCIDLTLDSDEEIETVNTNNNNIAMASSSRGIPPIASSSSAHFPNNALNNNKISARTNSQSSTNSNFSGGHTFNEAIFNKNLLDDIAQTTNLNSVNLTASNDIRFEISKLLFESFLLNNNNNFNNINNENNSNEYDDDSDLSCIMID